MRRTGYSVFRVLAGLVLLGLYGLPIRADPRNTFRFIVMADTHIGMDDPAQVACYSNLVIEIVTSSPRPAAVFSTGDLTHHGLAREYALVKAWLVAPLAAAGIPFFAVPGNHEIGGDGPHHTLAMWENKMGPLYQSVMIQQTHFLLTCGVPKGVTGAYGVKSDPAMPFGIGQAGVIDRKQLAWIHRQLTSAAGSNAVMTLMLNHYPLWHADFEGNEIRNIDYFGNPTGAGASLRAWLDRPGSNLFLCGHLHFRAAPVTRRYPSGHAVLHVLNEAAIRRGYGYDVYDVDGSTITHFRKKLGSSIPQAVFSFPDPGITPAHPPAFSTSAIPADRP
jgi:predicted phosphodiesterase